MKKTKVTIGSLCKIGRGSSPRPINDTRYFDGGNIPWIKIADATSSFKKIYSTREYVNEYGASFSRKLKAGSLILATSGSLGTPYILGVDGCIHDGWLYIDEFNGLDKNWFYYKLLTLHSYFNSSAYGSAIQNINTDILRDTLIELPSLESQREIASILSAYDDLIDTNRRRIQLLEESARLLFREWFVYFRFPGHEKLKIVDDVPEGWERGLLGDIAAVKKGRNITFEQAVEGDIPVVGGGLEPTYYHNKANVSAPVITISASGANAGYVNMYDTDIWASDCSYIDNNSTKYIYSLYLRLKSLQTSISGFQVGAAQPHVYPRDLNRLRLLVAPDDLCAQFEQMVTPIFSLIKNLKVENQKLAQARDLLLPRLMSGAIEV